MHDLSFTHDGPARFGQKVECEAWRSAESTKLSLSSKGRSSFSPWSATLTVLPPGHLPVTGPGRDQISGFEPDLLTPSPLKSVRGSGHFR